jgi:toxin ParE1/3/4
VVQRVIWTEQALRDLEAIKDYIARGSVANAAEVVRAIDAAADRLADLPLAGRIIPDFADPNRRERFVSRWCIMYRVENDAVLILGIIHGSRLLSNVPGSFEEQPEEDYFAQ